MSPGARRLNPSAPHTHPDPATTQPRALRPTESPAISCELRSTSRQMRFESKVGGHQEPGATLSSAPFGRLYRPVLALPRNAPKTARCEYRCEDDELSSPHPLTALFNSPFIERGVSTTTSSPLNAQTKSQTDPSQSWALFSSPPVAAQGW